MSNWMSWAALATAFGGLLGWFVGLPAVIKIIATILDIMAPIFKAIAEAITGALKWTWRTIIWPALDDIFDNWRTAIFFLASLGLLYSGIYNAMDRRIDQATEDLRLCQTEVTKLQRSIKKEFRQEESNWLWDFFK